MTESGFEMPPDHIVFQIVEERRRTKTIPRFFTEKSGLKLVHATLIRAADNGQRVGITATERAQLP